ncbi:MAG: hypothetical protein ACYS0D_12765 [Planctomycetota bacterium]
MAGGGPQDQEGEPIILESFDDSYLPGVPGGGGAGGEELPAPVIFGAFASIQVNINAFGGNNLGDAANEPSIAVDPTAPNRIAIGWRQFDTIASNFRQGGFSSSRDGGRTWAAKSVLEPGIFRSDPVLGAGPDGTFYYLSLEVTPFNEFFTDMFISNDGGATWPIKNFAFGGDKQWFAIDATGGIGDGNIYQAWNVAGNQYFPNTFNRSVDGGFTWEDPVQYDPNDVAFPVFGLIDVGPDGAVYVAGAQNGSTSGTFWVVRSSNAQSGLIPAFDLITDIDLGGNLRIGAAPNPAGLAGQVNLAVDKSGGLNTGNIYVLCSVDPPGSDPMDVHFIRSTDSGVTFSAPVRVNDDVLTNAWQWFGQMSVAPNGRIDVVFNDTRHSGLANISELFYTFSTDGGLTWEPNIQVSQSFDSHVGWPDQNKLGDYYHMVSDLVGADLAYAATFNGGQDVYYLRIGDYDCNGNGVPDPDDIAAMASGDCNDNEIPDECEIAAGTLADDNSNGIPDLCDCQADISPAGGDGVVNVLDLIDLLLCFGQPAVPGCEAQDLNGDGTVDVIDLIQLLLAFGTSCP